MARGRRRRWVGALALVLVTIGGALALRPPSPAEVQAVAGQPPLWRGAYHVHSTQSDGSGSRDEIARAAAEAGLHFVILTDHGDGTRPPVPPRYVHGVLLLDAVEISTDDGHYVALGVPQVPYPLAGEGRAVAEDVRRFGGIGIVAHPDSPREALAWHDPSTRADGFEWVNADSTWRGASLGHLLARFFTYPLNRPATLAALACYPAALFAELDSPSRGPRLALAAVDAHARIGWQREADPLEGGRTVARFPSYRAMFGTFGVVAPWIGAGPSGDAVQDASAVLRVIRDGLAYSAVFSMADAPWLSLAFVQPGGDGAQGAPSMASRADADGIAVRETSKAATIAVRGNAPAGAVVRVRRNGQPWRESAASAATFALPADAPPGVYRAEVWLPRRRGWPMLPIAVSQALGHNLPRMPDRSYESPDEPMAITGWHVEHDPRSTGTVRTALPDGLAAATLTLAPGGRASQFAALVADLGPRPAGATGIRLALAADAPMRVSIQWREPRPGEGLRWRHSAYVDAGGRLAQLPIDGFRAIRPAIGPVPLDRVHALLLVMDTVNATPGTRRTLTVQAAGWTFDR